MRRLLTIRATTLAALVTLSVMSPSAQTAEDRPSTEALLAKQRTVQDRLARLEDRLFRVREALSQTQPESAERLELVIKRLGEMQVKGNIEDVLQKLEAGQLDDASEDQRKVLADLRAILKLLTDQRNDPDEQRKELEQLKEMRAQLENILKEEKAEQDASQRARRGLEHGKDLAMAAEKVKSLIRRQEELRQRTQIDAGQGQGRMARTLAQEQDKLSMDTQAMGFFLEELADWLGEKAEEADARADEADTDQPADARPSTDSPGPATSAKKHVDQAVREMENAENALNEEKSGQAANPQQAALENLQLALKQLNDAHDAMDTSPDFPKMAADQRGTQKLTERLARQMGGQSPSKQGQRGKPDSDGAERQAQAGPEGGQQKDGTPKAQGRKPPAGQKPSPGARQVAEAEKNMGDAAEDLDKQDPAEAEADQEKALDKLESAMAELDDAIEQLREELHAEVLRDLQDRFQAMLKEQTSIKVQTAGIHDKGSENWKRAEELKLASLGKAQSALGDDAMKALELLSEEGSTTVFPRIVEDMADQMYTVSDRVAAAKVGPVTQRMQGDIIDTLEELLDSLEQAAGQGGRAGGGGGGGQGRVRLVPTSAELKMLRSMQIRVNRSTEALSEAGAVETEVEKLIERQLDVSDMAREMHERMLEGGQ